MELGVDVQMRWDDGADHMLLQFLTQLLQWNVRRVLSGQDNGVDALRNAGAFLVSVFDCYLERWVELRFHQL
jgi:hypothetical protein